MSPRPRPQRERLALAITLLAVVAVPALVAIALGYHRFAFYGMMGAAFTLILAMPMATTVSFPTVLLSGLAVLVTLLLGSDPLPLAAWMGALGLGVGLVSIAGYHRAGTLVALSACLFIARDIQAGDVPFAVLTFTACGLYGAAVARAVRKGPPRPLVRIAPAWAALYGVLLAGLLAVATGVTVALEVPHGYWSVLAILVVAQPASGTPGRAAKRATAVIVGVVAAMVIIRIVDTQAAYAVLTAVAIALAAYQASSTRPYFATAFMSIAFILASGTPGSAMVTAEVRLATNLLALIATVALASVVSWVIGHRGASPTGTDSADPDALAADTPGPATPMAAAT